MRNYKPNWKFPDLVSVPVDFQLSIGGSSLVANTLFRRGHTSTEKALGFLDPSRYEPSPASVIPDLELAAERVITAINQQERILVWGDFDVDGQTSTSLLISALKNLGAIAHHYIPNRAQESHGVSVTVLSEKIQSLSPQLIITCDTGIDAFEEALKKASVEYKVFMYEGAGHAFFNDTGTRYHKEAAALAWKRTIAFFKETLKT